MLPTHLATHKAVKRLILVRHGETEYNVQRKVQGRGIDAELNDNGKEQAQQLAKRLKDEPIHFVASSSLTRAIQTAEIVLQQRRNNQLPIHLYDGIQEMGFGPEFEGKVFDPDTSDLPNNVYKELASIIHRWTSGEFGLQIPGGGESPLQVESRSRKAIQQILQLVDEQEQPISLGTPTEEIEHFLIVCHGRLLKILLCSLLDIGLENMEKFAQNNTAVNILEYDDKSKTFTAILLNCTSHLQKPPNN